VVSVTDSYGRILEFLDHVVQIYIQTLLITLRSILRSFSHFQEVSFSSFTVRPPNLPLPSVFTSLLLLPLSVSLMSRLQDGQLDNRSYTAGKDKRFLSLLIGQARPGAFPAPFDGL
jgi:hypothetical protein